MRTWQIILDRHWDLSPEEEAEFGEHSHTLWSLFEWANMTPFFTAIGAPISSEQIIKVHSWKEALVILETMEDTKYSPNGHLWAVLDRREVVTESLLQHDKYQKAVMEVSLRASWYVHMPKALSEEQQDRLDLHLGEFVMGVIEEIMFPDKIKDTYFRDLIPWFDAGHFPCGWEGDWPLGKLRVF